jgi:2-aminobenzoate-CoA ligase
MPISFEKALPPKHLWPDRIYTLPETRYPARLNVARELLDANAEGGRAGRPAIYFQDRTLTYGELQRLVNRLAGGLRAAVIDQGDRLLMRLPNGPEFIITWLACQKLGAIAVSTMPMLRARELAAIIEDAGTATAVVWGGLRDELEKARAAAPGLEHLIVAGEARPGDAAWAGLMVGSRIALPPPTRAPTTWR